MDTSLLPGYTEVKKLTENPYRVVTIVKDDNDGRKYVSKVYNKPKLMQNRSMVQNVLNEK